MVSMQVSGSWCCNDRSCGKVQSLSSRDEVRQATRGRNKYILARHGMAEQNVKEIFGGQYPEPVPHHLVEEGIRAVERTAKEISEIGTVDLILSSPLTRAVETAEIISRVNGNAPIETDDRLRERNHGDFEGRKVEDLFNTHPDSEEYFTIQLGGIETFTEIQRRVFDCAKDLERKHSNKTIVMVSHGDPTWLLKRSFEGWTVSEAMEVKGTFFLPPGGFIESDFGHFSFDDMGELDLSKPYINTVTFHCNQCEQGVMKLIPS